MDVRDAMSRDVITVRPETPLKEVARLMVEHAISGVPVVDDTGLVVGVVSEADFVIKERGVEGIHRRLLARFVGDSAETEAEFAKVVAERAGSAMTSPPITIDVGAPLRDAATLMVERRINRLPVLDGTRLVGIVSRADLVRAYLRSDAELEAAIREGVLLRELWQEETPGQVSVTVVDGVAHLAGNVDRRSSARLILEHVGAVEGVVGVESELTWTLDDAEIAVPEHDFVSPYTV
jgi:CBS domain-containing protein